MDGSKSEDFGAAHPNPLPRISILTKRCSSPARPAVISSTSRPATCLVVSSVLDSGIASFAIDAAFVTLSVFVHQSQPLESSPTNGAIGNEIVGPNIIFLEARRLVHAAVGARTRLGPLRPQFAGFSATNRAAQAEFLPQPMDTLEVRRDIEELLDLVFGWLAAAPCFEIETSVYDVPRAA